MHEDKKIATGTKNRDKRFKKLGIATSRTSNSHGNLCAGQIVLPHAPPGSTGVRENMCVIKKGGALEKRVIFVII